MTKVNAGSEQEEYSDHTCDKISQISQKQISQISSGWNAVSPCVFALEKLRQNRAISSEEETKLGIWVA